MSKENVELLRSSYEAWNRSGFEAVRELLAPEFELHLPEGGLNTGVRRGPEAMKQFVDNLLEAFDDIALEPEAFFDHGDRVVVFVRAAIRGKGSGVALAAGPAHVWTMRSGKAVRMEIYPEHARDRALESAGVESS